MMPNSPNTWPVQEDRMAGIISYGAYIPYLRLPLPMIAGGRGGDGAPEKAVANWDEDSVTMAVAAATACLAGRDRSEVDGVLFASTSYAFKEKQAAAIIAKALDLRRDVLTTDLGDSLRAGTNALRAGLDSIKAGSAKCVLVVVGDVRMAAPRSAMEPNLGDGAAALLLGDQAIAAEVVASQSVADEIIDVWRGDGDPFVHAWEDRFVVDHGYRHNVKEVVRALLQKQKLEPKDITRAVLYGPDARSHATAVRDLKLAPAKQAQDPLFDKGGRAGVGMLATRRFRDRDDDVTLLGIRCRRCGTTQYPSQRVCYGCFAKDDFDKVRLSDKIGTVKSFTFDNFAGSPDPPLVATVTDIEGARLYLQMTDA